MCSHALKFTAQFGQLDAGIGRGIHGQCRLIGSITDRRQAAADFLSHGALLLGGRCNLLVHCKYLAHSGGYFRQRALGLVGIRHRLINQCIALAHVLHRTTRYLTQGGDKPFDFRRRLLGTARQRTYFICVVLTAKQRSFLC